MASRATQLNSRIGTRLDIAPNSIDDDIWIGTALSRSGAIVIGDAAQTTATTAISSGKIDVVSSGAGVNGTLNLESTASTATLNASTTASVTGDIVVCEGTSTTYLGSKDNVGSATEVHNSATTGALSIGSALIGGIVNICTNSSQSGAITIGNSSAGNTLNIGAGNIDIDTATEMDVLAGSTLKLGGAGAVELYSTGSTVQCEGDTVTYLGGKDNVGSATEVHNSATTGALSIGNAMVGGVTTICTNALQTGAITIGSATGKNTLNLGAKDIVIGAANTMIMTTADDFDILAGGDSAIAAVGQNDIISNTSSVRCEGETVTYLGGKLVPGSQTDVHTAATTGALNIGTNVLQSGVTTIGNPACENTVNIGGGTMTISTKTSLDLTSVGPIKIIAPTSDVHFEGSSGTVVGGFDHVTSSTVIHNKATTGALNIGNAVTTGDVKICTGTARTGTFQIGSNDVGATGSLTICGISVKAPAATNPVVPTVSLNTGTAATMSVNTGTQRKWGAMCAVQLQVQYSALTGTGNVQITTGLSVNKGPPIMFKAASQDFIKTTASAKDRTNTYWIMNTGGNTLGLVQISGTTPVNMTDSDINTSGLIYLSFSYMFE